MHGSYSFSFLDVAYLEHLSPSFFGTICMFIYENRQEGIYIYTLYLLETNIVEIDDILLIKLLSVGNALQLLLF